MARFLITLFGSSKQNF